MANPFPFVAGSVLTAAELNGIGEAWTSYTPTVTQGVAITKTITYAKYARVNKTVIVSVSLALTSAGTASSILTVSLPLTSLNTSSFTTVGQAFFYDASAATPYPLVSAAASTSVAFWSTTAGGNFFGAIPAVTVANGDFIGFTVAYEVA